MLTVLVTGAAGLIGGEVSARLAARGHRVLALVRRTRVVRGNGGANVPVAQIVPGDITQPMMALDPAALRCDLVIHCAASLEFDAPQEELQAVNVAGTAHALDFARAAGAQFLHISTAYVCGLEEGLIRETPVPAGRRFANRYEASKAAGEALVRASGLAHAIARPAIVVGDHPGGAIRDFPSLCNVFRLMARGKVRLFPAAAGATLNLVPIDHVAEGIVRIAERMDAAHGGHFHLVTPSPIRAAELAHAVARVPHFPVPQVVEPEAFDHASLSPIEARVTGPMLATFGGYFTRNPRFDDGAMRALTGLACPPTDAAWLDRLVAYGIARGYLPAPPADGGSSARRDIDPPADPVHQAPTSSPP